MAESAKHPDAERRRSEVLAKAVAAAAARLDVSQAELGRIIGISKASVSRMVQARFALDPASKPGELALLFVRLFRSLDSIVGTDAAARRWLGSHNQALNGRPAELIRTTEGLVHVLGYLDAQRARI
jgi:uncharacterized protein (DUF2384 family)